MSLSVDRCPQCKTARRPGETSCRRCGFEFSRAVRPVGPTLVLRQLRPTPADTSWEVSDESVEVGRANPSARIALSDSSVSRRHARISFSNPGYVVEDLGSANHTFVNERELRGPTEIGRESGRGRV